MADTIIALATAPIKSALALIRVSGDDSFRIVSHLFDKPSQIKSERKMVFGNLIKEDKLIDQVMLFLYPKEHSMTGEDVVEISCHGSMIIVNEIIGAFLNEGARYAERGEFTERAFLNGKIDLIQAEAINEMINAKTNEGKEISLLALEGKTSSLVKPIKEDLASLLSLIEVNIDYPEYEDIEVANSQKVIETVEKIQKSIANLIQKGQEGIIIKEGIKIAIAGEPNVGKSSLLNALMNEDKAIVSSIPGTTRDVVEGDFSLKGIPFHLLDTAGLRKTDDYVESLGIIKSEKSIKEADVVIWVLDASKYDEREHYEEDLLKGKKVIKVWNKTDLNTSFKPKDGALVSAKNGEIKPLLDALMSVIGVSEEAFSSPSLSNARQIGLLNQIYNLLSDAKEAAMNDVPMDLISSILQRAYNNARALLGEDASLDLVDEIFSRFCVGK